MKGFAQIQNIDSNVYYTPGGILDNYFDNYGNKYLLNDIRINSPFGKHGEPIEDKSILLCQSGYFDLYFEDGSGMEDINNTTHNERRNVICQLFSDLSNFITSPISSNGLGTRVNILVRDIEIVVPNAGVMGVLGVASSFYNMPANNSPQFGGIVDNEIWKTINSGIDSYTNVTSPLLNTDNTNSGMGNFFHGIVAFNFLSINWNLILNNITSFPGNEYDLYSVALHEVTHALGFASLIDYNGNSKFNSTDQYFQYYTRYDLFLKDKNNINLLTNTGANPATCSSMYNYQFNPSLSALTTLTPGCTNNPPINNSVSSNATNCTNANKYVGSNTVKVYTSSCFEGGSSLSHFEDQCYPIALPYGNDEYFCMSNAQLIGADYNTGTTNFEKRYLKLEERGVLCDLRYSTVANFGTSSMANDFSYGSSCTNPNVIGINDGIAVNSSYIYTVNSGSPITLNGFGIDGFLTNDFISTGYTKTFECPQDVFDPSATISSITASSFVFAASTTGLHLIRYVPVSVAGGLKGNITYIYVYVLSINCIPSACNLINNGGFEINSDCGQVSGTNNNPLGTNLIECWYSQMGTPDLYKRQCIQYPFCELPSASLVCYGISVGETWDNSILNSSYIGLAANYLGPNMIAGESIQTNLNSPILPNVNYLLSLRVKKHCGSNNLSMTLFGYEGIALMGEFIFFPPNFWNFNVLANRTFNVDDNWHYYEIEFIYTGTEILDYFILMNTTNNDPSVDVTYFLIDDLKLTTLDQAGTISIPETICLNQPINDLTQYITQGVQNGVFSGSGVSLSGGLYSFNPAIAGIGTHEINYTYTTNIGCVFTISDYITVNNANVTPTTITASSMSVCVNQNVTLTASNAATAIWQPGNLSGSSITINPTLISTYNVSVTNANGCISESSITIEVAPQIIINAEQSDICMGGSTTLQINGGNSSTTYLWANNLGIAESIVVSPTITTIYSVTGTDANGCTSTAFFTINVISTPISINLIPSYSTICSGHSVNLTASGGNPSTIYSWDNSLSDGAFKTVYPTSTTSYTVVGTQQDGCQGSASIIITVLPSPTVTLITSSASICIGESITLTASGASSYTWNNGLSPGNPKTFNPPTQGQITYIVTGTIANGCSNTANVTVSVNDCSCIPIATSNSPIGTIGTINGSYAPNYYYIENNVVLAGNTVFTNAKIFIAPNVKITIPTGKKLTLKSCHLLSCSMMWDGIYVEDGGEVLIQGSSIINGKPCLIENALKAVNFTGNSSKLTVTRSIFNRNLIGINMSNTGETTVSIGNISIKDNVFTCRSFKDLPSNWPFYVINPLPFDGFRANYSYITATQLEDQNINEITYSSTTPIYSYLQAPYLGLKSAYGIHCSFVGLTTNEFTSSPGYIIVTIGDNNSWNLFDNLSVGISADYSNVSIIKNRFQNTIIDGNNAVSSLWKGRAIYFSTGKNRKKYAFVNNSIFTNCHYGIEMVNYFDVTFSSNTFKSTQRVSNDAGTEHQGKHAIKTKSNAYRNLTITSNKIYNIEYGITFDGIFGNINNGIPLNNYYYSGDIKISSNTIQPNYLNEVIYFEAFVKNGIIANNVLVTFNTSSLYLLNNKLIIYDNDIFNTYQGIRAMNWKKQLEISKNEISLRTNTLGLNPIGIEYYNNTTTTVYVSWMNENKINGPGFGVSNSYGIKDEFSTNTDFKCNEIKNIERGLSFKGTCTGSLSKRNKFENNKYAFVINGMGTSIGSQGNMDFPADNEFVFPWVGSNYMTLVEGGASPVGNLMYVHNSLYNGNYLNPNSNSLADFGSFIPYSNPSYIIYSTTNNTQTCPNVLFAQNNQYERLIIDKENILQHLNGEIPLEEYPDDIKYNTKKQLHKILRSDILLLENETLLQNFVLENDLLNHGKLLEIEQDLVNDELLSAQTKLIALEANTVDENFAKFFDIYLNYNSDSITNLDSLNLTEIGNMCPIFDGSVVYQARALYEAIYGYDYLFIENCQTAHNRLNNSQDFRNDSTIQIENKNLSNEIVIYPNPSKDKFIIKGKNILKIKLFDFVGREIDITLLKIDDNSYMLTNLKNEGIYNCIIETTNETKVIKIQSIK
jgi:hypothetical protein